MKKINFIIISYLLIFFNYNLLGNEPNKILKIGLLVPLSGEYKELGDSFLYSLQLALEEVDDSNVFIVPRDSGFKDKKKINKAIQEFKDQKINVVIGPISFDDLMK